VIYQRYVLPFAHGLRKWAYLTGRAARLSDWRGYLGRYRDSLYFGCSDEGDGRRREEPANSSIFVVGSRYCYHRTAVI
jgi:hypothetical protein